MSRWDGDQQPSDTYELPIDSNASNAGPSRHPEFGQPYQQNVYYAPPAIPTEQYEPVQQQYFPTTHAQGAAGFPPHIVLPGPPPLFSNPENANLPYAYVQGQQAQLSATSTLYSPENYVTQGSVGSSGSNTMQDYFPSYDASAFQQPLQQPSWIVPSQAGPSAAAAVSRKPPSKSAVRQTSTSSKGAHANKSTRQQFTACGACRHRRVKCDLKDRQEEAGIREEEDDDGVGQTRKVRQKRVQCTNCNERGTNCV
jgi:hypothetical protein